METKTKKTTKKQGADWKDLVHGFVGNMLEQVGDNIMQKIHNWIKLFKQRTIAFVLMILGIIYLLVGLSVLLNVILGQIIPGLGYITIGVLAMLLGYLINNNKK